VTPRAAGARYARALFDVVTKERGDLQEVGQQLAAFSRIVAGNELLSRVLTNPAIPAPRKRAAMEHLIAKAGGLAPALTKLLLLLADRDRLVLLPDLDRAFQNRLLDHAQVVRAEVVTAVALPGDRIAALQQGLARATGRQVQLENRVDPSIIGGAIAKVGSTVYDGSVTRQLEKIKEALTSAAS
jgi:F-type H+-transporting ATPase subunit delta